MRSGRSNHLLFLLSIAYASSSIFATSADPAASLHMSMRDLCSGITGTIPTVSMFMVIAGGVIYASGQIMGSEARGKANIWAAAALTGAVIGGITTAVTPGVLETIYGADVNCMASGAHGSYSFCGTAVGELCCQPDNHCGLGLVCDTATGRCSNNCGKTPGGDCCPKQWCGNAPGLYCDPSSSKCSPLCSSRSQPCCDVNSCQSGLECSDTKICQGCGNNGESCCKTGVQCNLSATSPRLACGVNKLCQSCGTIVGSLCCSSSPYCSPANSSCNSTSSYCAHCGLAGELCCPPSNNCSQANYSCQSGACQHCGSEDEACCPLAAPNDCDNSSAIRPLSCKSGFCKYTPFVCGGNNEQCCQPNNNCSSGFDCNTTLGKCLPCGAANSKCCPANPGPQCPASLGSTASNPNLFCNDSNNCQACGTTNAHCCYNATSAAYDVCTSAGAICNSSSICQHTGNVGEPCSPTGSCNTGFTCINGPTPVCLQCGGAGQDCCAGACPYGTSSQPLQCNSTLNKCQQCGLNSQSCCVAANATPVNTTCNAPSACNATGVCSTCGLPGAGCCNGTNCTTSGYTCNTTMASPICIACGSALGQPCCGQNGFQIVGNNNKYCNPSSLVCFNGTNPGASCAPCGSSGKVCCGNGSLPNCGQFTSVDDNLICGTPKNCGSGLGCYRPTGALTPGYKYDYCYSCGGANQTCCANNLCTASGYSCNTVNGTCQLCGAAGQSCCYNATTMLFNICSSGLKCNDTPVVPVCYIPCGNLSQPCCAGNNCTQVGTGCNIAANQCQTCGGAGQPCCNKTTCTASGQTCNTTSQMCMACGAAIGQPCCGATGSQVTGSPPDSRYCNPRNSLACFNGETASATCTHCGASNEVCCGNGSLPTCSYSSLSGITYFCGTSANCSGSLGCYSPTSAPQPGYNYGYCYGCGGAGQPCCANNNCTTSGYACNTTAQTCQLCGAQPGQICCRNTTNLLFNNCTNTSLACDTAPVVPVCNSTELSCGMTLNIPNKVYTLTKSLTSTGTCFNVTAANVTLNCNGFTITGSNAASSYGVYSNQQYTKVQNCRISSFATGIVFNGATYGTISGSTASTAIPPYNSGVFIGGGSYNTIINSTGISTSSYGLYLESYGISISGSSNNAIINSTGISNSSSGIYLSGSSNNAITSSTGTSTATSKLSTAAPSNGIALSAGSNYNTITGSSGTASSDPGIGVGIFIFQSSNNAITSSAGTSTSGYAGIELGSGSYNTITNSTASASGNGISLQSSSNNAITNCTASASGSAIYLRSSSTNTFIRNKFASGASAVTAYIGSSSTGNTFALNNFSTATTDYYIYDYSSSGSNFYNTTINGHGEGNIYPDVMNGSVSITGTIPSSIPGLYAGTTSYSSSNGKMYNAIDYAPLTPSTVLACGPLNIANHVYTMTANLVSSATCFTVTAQNVTLNCNGYSITGSNQSGTYGIYSNQYGTKINNCRISNFDDGIYFAGATYGTINGTTASSIFYSNTYAYQGCGIVLHGASNNMIMNSVGTTNSNVGISLYSSSNFNTIINSAGSSSYIGTYIYSSSNNNILNSTMSSIRLWTGTNNIIANSTLSNGLMLTSSSAGNTFTRNTFASGASSPAVSIASSSTGNTFALNNFTTATTSYVQDNSGGNFYNTTINGHGEGNIYPNVMDGTIPISGTTPSSIPGLYVGTTSYGSGTSSGNKMYGATDYAPLTPRAGCTCGTLSTPNKVCTLTGNLTSSGTCFNVQASNVTINCNGFTITGSNASGSYGIYSNRQYTNINNCRISNFMHGIYFSGATYGTISGTTSNTTNSNGYGIYLSTGSNNAITSSIGASTTCYGIYLEGSSYNTITSSTGADSPGVTSYCAGISLHSNSNYNTITSSVATSNFASGLWFEYGAYNTITSSNITSNSSAAIILFAASNNVLTRNKFASGLSANAVSINSGSTGNTFALNNFTTASSSYYVYDYSGSTNYFNATVNGINQGNIYPNVISGAIQVSGTTPSSIPGLYVGSSGTGYPYSPSNSGGKMSGATDYAPLTPTNVLTCGVLSMPNKVYNMTQSLTSTGTCFTVQATNVTINCNGYSINGNNASNSFGIRSDRQYTRVNNCKISNFDIGVYFYGATYGTINGTSANTTSTFSGNGIDLSANSNYNTISNSTGTSNSGVGIQLAGSSNYNTVSNSAGTSNSGYGIYLESALSSTISNSTGTSNSGVGIYLSGSSSTSNTISNSIGTSNSGYGISLYGSSSNTISNSTATSSSKSGVYTYYSSTNTFTRNKFASGPSAATAYIDSGSSGNTFALNNFTTATSSYYVQDNSGGNFYNATINGVNQGNIYSNVMDGTIPISGTTASSIPGLYVGTTSYGPSNSGSKMYGATDYAPLTPRAGCTCGTITTPNSVCTLTGNLASTGTCLTVAASNVTINCNGYSITGTNAANTYGVSSNQYGTKINNCGISGFQTGIYFNGVTYGTINGTTVSTSINYGQSIYLYSSSYNSIVNSTGTNNAAYYNHQSGIILDTNSNFNTIANSTGIGVYGIYIISSSNNKIMSATGISTNGNIGIGLDTNSNYNTIANSTGTANSGTGIYLRSSSYNTIANSTTTLPASYGAYLSSSPSNTFIRNTFAATLSIYIDSGSSGNTFALNNLSYTGTCSYCAVQDIAGGNYFNATVDDINQGNIYPTVMRTPGAIYGFVSSSIPGLFIGSTGYGYPLSSSIGRVTSNVVDYAPLTPYNKYLCGATLSTPNEVYNMTANLQSSGGTCFTVAATNVTINCNGFSITGSDSPGSYGIYSNQSRTTINNCKILNYGAGTYLGSGIYFNGATYGTINRTTVGPNRGYDILLYSGSNNNIVTNSTGALDLDSSSYNTITNSSGSFHSTASSYNTITNFNGSAVILSSSSHNTITNSAGALYLSSSSYNAITNSNSNQAIGNHGVYLGSNSNYNAVVNSSLTSSYSSVDIESSSNNNFTRNIFAAGASKVTVYIDPGSSGNTFALNNFTSTNRYYDVQGNNNGNNYFNATINGINQGNIYANVVSGAVQISGSTQSSIPGLFVGSSGTGYPYSFANLQGSYDYAPLTPTRLICGWTQRTGSGNRGWYGVASSSDGTKLVATVHQGYVYTSADSGATWTAHISSSGWTGAASSSDGAKLAAVGVSGYVYTSSDSGATWTAQTSAGSWNWYGIASSSDGTKLVATSHTSGGYIYTSADSGATWTQRMSSGNWYLVASSSDGTKLVAANLYGYIYTSADSGATWTARTNAGTGSWWGVASSSDGTKLVAGNYGGYIYTSADSGATWIQRTGSGSRSWHGVSSSSDGTKLAAVDNAGYIYISNDSGATWTAQTSAGSRAWYSIASSSDGNKLVAIDNSGYIWTYSSCP